MTTANDLVEETRRLLMSGQRDPMNKLAAAPDADDTTFTFTYDLNQIQAGAYVAVGLEIVYVWSADPTAKTATVERGVLGSTAASHASGDLAYANPRFPTFSIFQALNSDLDDLCAPNNGLYATSTADITFDASVGGFDLGTSSFIDVVAVQANYPGTREWDDVKQWRVQRKTDTDDFASGTSLELYGGMVPGYTVRVVYSVPFTHFTDLTTNVTATNLPTTAYDLPPLGAAMKLAGVREVQRNFTDVQADPRRSTEVGTNAQVAGMQAMARLRQQRIKAEATRLQSAYPYRRKV